MTMSSADRMLPMVALVPSVGQVDAGAQRVPSEVAEQTAMTTIPLLMMGRMGLSIVLMALTMASMT